MSKSHNSQAVPARREDWILNLMLGVPILLLLAFTVALYPVDLDLLLPFFVLLCGAGLFASTVVRWGRGRIAPNVALAGCAAGVLWMLYGGIEISALPTGVRSVTRVVIPLLFLVVMAYWQRVWKQPTE